MQALGAIVGHLGSTRLYALSVDGATSANWLVSTCHSGLLPFVVASVMLVGASMMLRAAAGCDMRHRAADEQRDEQGQKREMEETELMSLLPKELDHKSS